MSEHRAVAGMSLPQGARVTLNGRQVLMLGSNNYLGLANHPVVRAAAVDAIHLYGVGTCINPCFVRTPVHEQLEREVAMFVGTEEAILFASCSAANAGVLTTLVASGDTIYSDSSNHASIIDGCKLSRADVRVYPHCDVQALRSLMAERSAGEGALVITDGIFSMEGDLAPLDDLLAAAQDAGATLVVDDSHGLAVAGPGGRGSMAAAGRDSRHVLTTGTFSKALGGAPGGFVAGPRDVVAKLRDQSRSFIFTSGMSVPDAAAALAALRLVADSTEHVDRLWANTGAFRRLLAEAGVPMHDAASPITPLHVGNDARARVLHARLVEKGVYVPAMVFPVVPPGRARLRAQPSAALSPEDIVFAARTIQETFEELAA